MTDVKIDKINTEEEQTLAERQEVIGKIQAILDEYGYQLGVTGFGVIKV